MNKDLLNGIFKHIDISKTQLKKIGEIQCDDLDEQMKEKLKKERKYVSKRSKKKRSTLYYHIKEYSAYLQDLKDRKITFELTTTSYSRKIKTERSTILFNQDAKGDLMVLKLINKVRKDANDYLAQSSEGLPESYIHYFDLMRPPKHEEVISKIDVKGAYWNYARKQGIISEETHKFLVDTYRGRPVKQLKGARLKALGSLATTKRTIQYIDGKEDWDTENVSVAPTKMLYLDVCRGVDELMRQCSQEVSGCIYYYWDCMFVNERYSEDVIKYFKSLEYDVTVKHTVLEFVTYNNVSYFISKSDDKMYMVRPESKKMIEDEDWEFDPYISYDKDYGIDELSSII